MAEHASVIIWYLEMFSFGIVEYAPNHRQPPQEDCAMHVGWPAVVGGSIAIDSSEARILRNHAHLWHP